MTAMKNWTPVLGVVALVLSLNLACRAQAAGSEVTIPGIPSTLSWENAPESWAFRDGVLRIKAGAKTDLFRDPRGEYMVDNAPTAFFSPPAEFLLSASVKVEFKSDYDAGALIVYEDDKHWAKLAYELSPRKEPTLVSVVTKGVSDDVNHSVAGKGAVYLRVAGLGGGSYAFHYSADGRRWRLLRYFSLGSGTPARVGFASQSPLGSSCQATFGEIRYKGEKLTDIRNGQ